MRALLGSPESCSPVPARSRSSRYLFEATFDAKPEQLAAIRRIVRDHLQWWAVSAETTERLLYAVNELLTNVIRHVPADEQGRKTTALLMQQVPGGVAAVVRDKGSERPVQVVAGPTAESGRGLTLVRALVDELEVAETGHGKDTWVFITDPASPVGP
ncbi:ATP-binding protein [Streptomyces cinerochromogenes]|uniref:ATP-binding protein n=1 Tax=Streptomyces cinerochromogenes TaxID=66422 RepID=UPI0036981609